jgi:monofunctional biosynthetic peptidoglycan transglycosylase
MPAPRRSFWRRLAVAAAALIAAAGVALAALWAGLPDVGDLAARMPRSTALVEQRRTEARRAGRRYLPEMQPVPMERISPRLAQAVVLSEDAGFWVHGPFDWGAMREALERNLATRRYARGASTITQQLAKNLYLGTDKTISRKIREAVLAVKLEREIPKRRILAIYLNVVEWGDGLFGAEAAARARFGRSAADLTTAQAVLLASMLPAPRRCDLDAPSAWLKRRSRRLLDRMREVGRIDADEHARAAAELERLLAGAAPADDSEEPPVD